MSSGGRAGGSYRTPGRTPGSYRPPTPQAGPGRAAAAKGWGAPSRAGAPAPPLHLLPATAAERVPGLGSGLGRRVRGRASRRRAGPQPGLPFPPLTPGLGVRCDPTGERSCRGASPCWERPGERTCSFGRAGEGSPSPSFGSGGGGCYEIVAVGF